MESVSNLKYKVVLTPLDSFVGNEEVATDVAARTRGILEDARITTDDEDYKWTQTLHRACGVPHGGMQAG